MLAEAGLFGEHLLSIISVLQIADKRREEKGKAKRERYTQLNAEIQRTGRRDKRAFLSEHCKEIEENNRMEKTRNLFKKTGDIKGTFHVRKRRIKDRNGKDLPTPVLLPGKLHEWRSLVGFSPWGHKESGQN